MDAYYNRGIKAAKLINGVPNADGVVAADIKAEIDAGWPVIALLDEYNQYYTRTGSHAFPIFGYKEEQIGGVNRLWLLAYDTWYQDKASHTSYSTLLFPTEDEAHNLSVMSLTRQGITPVRYYKLYAFAFMHVTGNPRCDAPLADTQSTADIVHNDEFDLTMTGQGESGREPFANCSKVYYDFRNPSPASECVDIVSGTATLHIDHDCSLLFRTYKEVAAPDGYLASKVVRRVYSVFSANKNIKKFADNTGVTMVNGIVTHVVDSDNFYFEERDKRLFGIRVHKAGHGLSTGDEVQVVVGTIQTDASNSERYITATGVTKTDPATTTVTPIYLTNISLGGQDYLPAGGSGTNYGQAGVVNSHSLNNIGLLVKAAGVVTAIDSATPATWFTISDGSGAVDSNSNAGVKVSAVGLMPSGLEVGDYVMATGISTAERPSNVLLPILLAREEPVVVTP